MPWLLTSTLSVAALIIVINLYVGWRLGKAARYFTSNSFLRRLPVLLLASFYVLPAAGLIHFLAGGEPKILEYPKFLTYWFWFGFVLSFQLLTWFILLDISKLVIKAATDWTSHKVSAFYYYSLLSLTGFLFIFTAVKMWYDTTQVEVEYTTVEVSHASEAFDDFRIVHISDLQGDEYTGRKEIAAYVQKVNALNPDLVVFTGDLISYGTDFIDMAAEELSKVKAEYGLYAVIGDHDYWAGVSNVKSAYQKYGVNLLKNENTIISTRGDSLLLTGITEVYDKQIAPDSLRQLASGYENISFEVMAAHQANTDVRKIAQKTDYEIFLGGHTHGGQLRVPFMFMHFSAPSFETLYLSGPYQIGELFLNVNNGLGFTLAPVRYDAQPSISVIDLD